MAAVLTLFDDDKIVENFSNRRASFNTVEISVTEPVTPLPKGKPLEFPKAFDVWRTVRNTTAIVVLKDGRVVF